MGSAQKLKLRNSAKDLSKLTSRKNFPNKLWLIQAPHDSHIALVIAAISALAILMDILWEYRQHMWIMNVVWPLTVLSAGPPALWFYLKVGHLSTHQTLQKANAKREELQSKKRPFWQVSPWPPPIV